MKIKPTSSGSRTKPYRVVAPAGYDGQSKRKPYYYRTKTEADEFAATINRWKTNETAPVDGTIQVDQAELRWLSFLRQELRDLSVLPEVIRHWKLTGTGSVQAASVTSSVTKYIEWRSRDTDNKRTMSDIRWRLKDFGKEFGNRDVHQITSKDVTDYMDSKEAGWTRKSFWKRVSQFFGWSLGENLVSIDPCAKLVAPSVDYLAPEIYSVQDVATILEIAEEHYKELFPFVAFSAFGFLRTSELVKMYAEEKVLCWEDVDWSQKLIHVKAGVAKGTRRKAGDERYIVMSDTLIEFLRPYARNKGQICELAHNAFYKSLNACLDKAEVDQVKNGLRHSCLSYFIAGHPETGVAEAAQRAGTSESVARRHYIKSLRPELGKQYFGLRRAG